MIEKVVELWHKGYNESEIAQKFDVPNRTIVMILTQQGEYY
jgi:orotate phosphoribosyltransferase-like protein